MQANDDVLDWVNAVTGFLDDSKTALVEFAAMTGVRAGEAVKAFNLAIELNQAGRLGDYYNRELRSLEHFKYPELFLRRTKNVFFSFVPASVIQRLTACDTVSYSTLRKHVRKHGLKMRLHELRNYYSTFLVHHGMIREEVDLLQGRIGQSIFMRHYFSPDIESLRDRVLRAVANLGVLN
jgi:intergrase/recombinase